MHKIVGTLQHFEWGSPTSIPQILGVEPTGEPVAEYWLGAHPLSPSTLGDEPLDAVIAEHPEMIGEASVRRFGAKLPYLLKLLSADHALSLQAHPSREQAVEGYAREEAAGVPVDAFERTFRDDWPKPEAIIALTDFHGLCGFRDPLVTAELFHGLEVRSDITSVIGPLTERRGPAALAEVFLDALSLDESRRHLVDEVVAAAVRHVDAPGELGRFARTAVELDEFRPGDPGILGALLLNRVDLKPGEGLFLGTGHLHAYIKGTAVEVMGNSDNVLRGGLTKKHIDVEALIAVVAFESPPVPFVTTTREQPGVLRYVTPEPEFALWQLAFDDPEGRVERVLPAQRRGRIVLCTQGHLVLECHHDELELVRGQAAFVPATDGVIALRGSGESYVAAPGV